MMALVGMVWISCVEGRLDPCLVGDWMGLARQGWVDGWVIGETSQAGSKFGVRSSNRFIR